MLLSLDIGLAPIDVTIGEYFNLSYAEENEIITPSMEENRFC